MSDHLPLEGVRVADLSRVLAGPFATMLLADLGADVIKVEPPDGDETRGWGPPWWGDPADRRSAYFASVNRNKRSAMLDFRASDARSVLERLLASSDLLVHNYRPATAARLGLAADALRARHPDLVVAAVGGFPGVDADRPAYDLLAQAVSGLMSVTGEPDGPPMKVGVALLDLMAGLQCAVGALAALVGRGRGERGARIDVNLIEVSLASLVNVLGNHLATGAEPARHGNEHPNIVPYQPFDTADGQVVIAVGNDAQFGRLCGVLRLDVDARFATNADRLANRALVTDALARAIGSWRRDELVDALAVADIPAGPVNTVGQAVAMLDDAVGGRWTNELDGIRLAPAPIHVDGRAMPARLPPPRLGEHTAEVLTELR